MNFVGAGASAQVYEVRRGLPLGDVVALKIWTESITPNDAARIRTEAHILSSLDHPNVAKVYQLGEWQNRFYLVMQLARGKSLAEIIEQPTAMTPGVAWTLLIQIAEALEYLHSQNVIHRDIKPSNIIVSDDMTKCTIVDFGLAMGGSDLHNTQTGALVGTPLYMAPEVLQGQRATKQSDIYAFGCTVYETLTGQVLYSGDTQWAVMMQHLRATLPQLPAFCGAILTKCLSKSEPERYESFSKLVADMRSIKTNDVTVERAKVAVKKRSRKSVNWKLAIKLAVPAVAVFLICLVAYWREDQSRRQQYQALVIRASGDSITEPKEHAFLSRSFRKIE